jgi:diacylglycerol kinase (ATP)
MIGKDRARALPEADQSKPALSKPGLGSWIAGRVRSFGHAGRGLFVLCLREPNFQIHLAAAVLAIGFGWFFGIATVEWLLLSLTISAVLAAEAFNTALEQMMDLFHPELHPLARNAKDLAAAAVLITSIAAAVIGIILFVPRILKMFSRGLT